MRREERSRDEEHEMRRREERMREERMREDRRREERKREEQENSSSFLDLAQLIRQEINNALSSILPSVASQSRPAVAKTTIPVSWAEVLANRVTN